MTSSAENVESCINLMQKVSNERNFEINFQNFYCNSNFIVAKGSFQLRERVDVTFVNLILYLFVLVSTNSLSRRVS